MFRSWLPLVAILFFSAAQCPAAKKDKETLPPPPPMPQAQDVAMYRGRSIEIPLRAIGRTPGQLRFIIRTQPKHGKLGPVQIIDRKNAVVTYIHDEKSSATADSFTFAVQGPDSPVSAPGVISLTISEEPPAFSVVREANFGTVTLGNTKSEEIILQNTGGGVLSGRLSVPPPWRIAGNDMYRLGRKEEQKIRIVFAPADDEEFNGQLRFSHDIKAYVTLTGTGFAPLAFDPAKELTFASSSDPARRTAALTLQNRTDAARSVEVEYPENVSGPEQILLKPKEDKNIVLQIAPKFFGSLESAIIIESEGYRVSLPLKAFAVKPILTATPADALAFGLMTPGDRKEATFELANSGGSPARLQVTPPKGLVISPDPATAVIPPGESRKFTATLELSKPGAFEDSLSIDYGGDAPLTLPVTARLESATSPSPSTAAAVSSQGAPAPTEFPATAFSSSGKPEPPGNDIPPIKELNHFRSGTHEIELGWKIPAKNAISYVIEWRQILGSPTGGPPIIKWNEWRGVQITEADGSIVARFPNLKDGQSWFIRVRTVDELGRKSAASPTFVIDTLRDRSMHPLTWLGILAAIGGLGAVFIFWRKRQQAAVDDETARISALENK